MPSTAASCSSDLTVASSGTLPPLMNRPDPLVDVRAILSDAWRLFQVSWLGCLPLALLASAASTAPSREGVRLGERPGFEHSPEWWGVCAASAALTVLCLSAVLLRQAWLADGDRRNPWPAMQAAGRALPRTLGLLLLLTAPLALTVMLLAAHPIAIVVGLCASLGLLLWMAFAWPALLVEGLSPAAALRRGAELVRGRLRSALIAIAMIYSVVVVYMLLTTILINLTLSVSGMPRPTGDWQRAISGLLLLIVGAVLSVWVSAAWIAAYRRLCASARADER